MFPLVVRRPEVDGYHESPLRLLKKALGSLKTVVLI